MYLLTFILLIAFQSEFIPLSANIKCYWFQFNMIELVIILTKWKEYFTSGTIGLIRLLQLVMFLQNFKRLSLEKYWSEKWCQFKDFLYNSMKVLY